MSKNLSKITWEELKELVNNKCVCFLNIAPIEQHGRHLPLGVDIMESKYWEIKVLEKLEKKYKDYEFLTMPIIPFGHGNIKGFPGNLYVEQSTLKIVVYDLLSNLVSWGLENIIIISGHADPKHLIAIEEACEEINDKFGICALSPMGAIFSGQKVGLKIEYDKEVESYLMKYNNDFHAGWIETSNMLYIDERLVKKNFKDQPDICANERDMINIGKISNLTKEFGHIGYPNKANKKLGEKLNKQMINIIYKSICAFIERKDYDIYKNHFLYNNPYLRTNGGV